MAGKRRVLGAAFKAKVALTAAKEDRTANLRLFDRIDTFLHRYPVNLCHRSSPFADSRR
jgi:hypothetical protein